MASREGIALLSMYNDDEEEDEEGDQEEAPQPTPPPLNESAAEVEEIDTEDEEGQIRENTTVADSEFPFEKPFQPPVSQESPSSDEDGESKTLITHVNSTPTPSPISRTPSKPNLSSSSSISSGAERIGFRRSRMDALGIVDYEHDDTALSPEKEENDNADAACFVQGTEIHNAVGVLEERVTSAVQVSTPNSQPSVAQPCEQPVISSTESTGAIDVAVPGSEMPHHELDGAGYAETEEAMDPLKKFLPPPPTTKCTHELQDKISKFLSLKKFGKSFNAELRKLKDYRNPDFLQHAVRYQGINQTGTCFSKDVFDPQGYDLRDYFDEIEADMRREIERRDQERKRSPKVEFVSGGTQHGAVVPAKINGIPAYLASVPISSTSGQSVPLDTMARDIRPSKKSKWDKVDVDARKPLQAGVNDGSGSGSHAALLSSSNMGAGYTAFAQQKRKEAEERRSSERKFEKRS